MQWNKMKERITKGCGAKPTIPAKEKTGMKAKAIGKKERELILKEEKEDAIQVVA